jgi:hypothetical protein|nr:MAG TPA: tail completion protein [Caudoviricetes sp.]
MIEIIVKEYLSKQLEIEVVTERSDAKMKKYLLIEKTGSSRENFIDTATITIQSYAESMYEAAVLNERVKKAMDDIAVLSNVSKSELNSDYNFTDTTKKEYRYQAVYDITYFY